MAELNNVQKFYKDKSIFITGASGFMGKVLLEKLLYSCSDLKQIFILMRQKKGKSAEERVEDFVKLPMFQRIMNDKPAVMKKIVPVFGDLSLVKLGLNDLQYNLLTQNTQVVFHLAASLKLESPLKPAVEFNLTGTKHVLDVCKEMKKMEAVVHLSTAFCNSDQEVMEEKVYDWPQDPMDLIRCAEWMDVEAMEAMNKNLMAPHPNTYLYTKRLAEILVRDQYADLPICIVRPSIVTPSFEEPLPGWVDSLNGPIGILVGGAKGVIRSMMCDENITGEVIPVDLAINGIIIIAKSLANKKKNITDVPVYNVTCSETKRSSWGFVLNEGKKINYEYPFEAGLWYPDGNMTTNKRLHAFKILFCQWFPAYLIDFLMLIFGQKRFMIHVQTRITQGLDLLQFFTMRQWDFPSQNFQSVPKSLSIEEQKMFNCNTETVDALPYLKTCMLGGRQYCLKEPLSTLPKARMQLKMLYCLDLVFKGFMLYFFASFLLKLTGLTTIISDTFNTGTQKMHFK